MGRRRPLEEKFWEKVDKTDGCWLWTAALYSNGYGHFRADHKDHLAHRLAWKMIVGDPVPTLLDHTCHVRNCVNPAHLRPATVKQNNENLGMRATNTSGVRGVSWHRRGKKWRAQVCHHGKTIHLGLFVDLLEAEAAVIAKRLELFTHNDYDRSIAR